MHLYCSKRKEWIKPSCLSTIPHYPHSSQITDNKKPDQQDDCKTELTIFGACCVALDRKKYYPSLSVQWLSSLVMLLRGTCDFFVSIVPFVFNASIRFRVDILFRVLTAQTHTHTQSVRHIYLFRLCV